MIIQLNMSGETPIYQQLRDAIVIGIAEGALEREEGLPTVRQMAEDLGINTMTVNKSYAMLKEEGFIEIDRRHGAVIRPKEDRSGVFREKEERMLKLLISEAKIKGFSKEEFMNYCENAFNELKYDKE